MMRLSDKGFTLIELLLAFSILVFCLCGILLTHIQMFILSDLSRDLTLATNAMQAKMEEIKKVNFDCLFISTPTPCASPASVCPCVCNNACFSHQETFNLEGIAEGKGRIEIETVTGYTDLKRIRLVASFKSRGRLIGEDKNLDGDLDTGEDTLIANNRLDSPVEVVTLIAR